MSKRELADIQAMLQGYKAQIKNAEDYLRSEGMRIILWTGQLCGEDPDKTKRTAESLRLLLGGGEHEIAELAKLWSLDADGSDE